MNWWLMALAFVLGLVLTGLFVVRRVTREVPVYESADAAPARLVDAEPYGAGSYRGATAPSGYDVKGNADSMLYHSTDSPHYGRTIAEIWFCDVETAEAAGFNRWDSGKSQRGKS